MSWNIVIHEDHPASRLPYSVTINGWWLTKKGGGRRRFSDTFTATFAATKRVDELRKSGAQSAVNPPGEHL